MHKHSNEVRKKSFTPLTINKSTSHPTYKTKYFTSQTIEGLLMLCPAARERGQKNQLRVAGSRSRSNSSRKKRVPRGRREGGDAFFCDRVRDLLDGATMLHDP